MSYNGAIFHRDERNMVEENDIGRAMEVELSDDMVFRIVEIVAE